MLPALCNKCGFLILVDERTPFAECPQCKKAVVVEDAVAELEEFCKIPANTNDIILRCLEIEAQYGPELPRAVLAIIAYNFPTNEEIVFLIVRFSDYKPQLVQNYLSRFSKDKKQVPWANEFLNKALTVRNMEYADLFQTYIDNKVKKTHRARYIELLRTLKESYTKISNSSSAIALLHIFFAVFATINFSLLFVLLFTAMAFWANVLIVFGVLCLQISIMFLHNKIFGTRVKISQRERVFLTVYMSSLVVAIGAAFLGSLFNL